MFDCQLISAHVMLVCGVTKRHSQPELPCVLGYYLQQPHLRSTAIQRPDTLGEGGTQLRAAGGLLAMDVQHVVQQPCSQTGAPQHTVLKNQFQTQHACASDDRPVLHASSCTDHGSHSDA